MKKFTGLIMLVIATCLKLQAQHSEGNPFARLGYKADVYTFGEKEEFHDLEEIVEIGEVLFNTKTNKVVGFIEDADSLIELFLTNLLKEETGVIMMAAMPLQILMKLVMSTYLLPITQKWNGDYQVIKGKTEDNMYSIPKILITLCCQETIVKKD